MICSNMVKKVKKRSEIIKKGKGNDRGSQVEVDCKWQGADRVGETVFSVRLDLILSFHFIFFLTVSPLRPNSASGSTLMMGFVRNRRMMEIPAPNWNQFIPNFFLSFYLFFYCLFVILQTILQKQNIQTKKQEAASRSPVYLACAGKM